MREDALLSLSTLLTATARWLTAGGATLLHDTHTPLLQLEVDCAVRLFGYAAAQGTCYDVVALCCWVSLFYVSARRSF